MAPKARSAKKKTKTATPRETKPPPPETCPVCFEPLREFIMAGQAVRSEGGHKVFDNSLACSNHHSVCVDCIAKMMFPSVKFEDRSSGLRFICPLCRIDDNIENFSLLLVAKKSLQEAMKCFNSGDQAFAWSGQKVLSIPLPPNLD